MSEIRMRLFTAVELPGPSRLQLAGLQAELDQQYFRPLKAENLHLTLVFLGDVSTQRLDELQAILRAAAAAPALPGTASASAASPTGARLSGMGAFPTLGNPRTVWAGFEDATGGVARLRKRIAAGLSAAGFPFDTRPFTPHITLAYTRKQISPGDLVAAGRGLHFLAKKHEQFATAPFAVREFVLFRSSLQPGGSVYEKIAAIGL
jgi:RNA 2',3'-cyclic 3'-phosphodiesterase